MMVSGGAKDKVETEEFWFNDNSFSELHYFCEGYTALFDIRSYKVKSSMFAQNIHHTKKFINKNLPMLIFNHLRKLFPVN